LPEFTFESPATIRTIERAAFEHCSGLESFIIPFSVSTLGEFAFSGCSSLSYVAFGEPSHLGNIPEGLFLGCDLLDTLELPDSVTEINGVAFHSSDVSSITGANCLISCSLLIRLGKIVRCFDSPPKIIISFTPREIGEHAFSSVESLSDFSLWEGLVHIGMVAFQCCGGLKTLTFPASLEVIGEAAFCDCSCLLPLKLATGSHLQCIHKRAFENAPLETVILLATVREIDPSAFSAKIWPLVQYDGTPPLFMNSDFLYSADWHILLNPFSESAAIIVPSSVETIGDRCFEVCAGIATIAFEASSKLKRIGECAFAESQLTSITIPASTEEIDGAVFIDCPKLKIRIALGSGKIERY
jgi:hypothetical protein